MKKVLIILAVLGIALGGLLLIGVASGGAGFYSTYFSSGPTSSFRTVTVKRDDLLSTISATGTVEPEEVVDVGAQVVGRIKSLGLDPNDPEGKKTIDYGSAVKENTVLAKIDEAIYKAQVDQADAALVRAKADLEQAKAKLHQADQDWQRAEKLHSIADIKGISDKPIKAISDSDYDLAKATYEVAKANVDVSAAMINQAEAASKLARTNFDYTVIKSPVDGVIIDRRVNVGQTVVASLNAPSLFLIARDLRKMQVWASVNEADIGKIRLGMPVRFTVDAFSGELFRGKVAQIRLNATMTQNVVTYTVVVAFDNSDLKVLPYLTANVQFELDQRPGVLLVPNAAIRWRPRPEQMAPEVRETAAAAMEKGGGKGGPPGAAPASGALKAATPREDRGRLWLTDGQFVRPVEVQIGATDGSQTEVSGEGVKEGMEVAIGEIRKDAGNMETTNPFTPKLRGTKKKDSQ